MTSDPYQLMTAATSVIMTIVSFIGYRKTEHALKGFFGTYVIACVFSVINHLSIDHTTTMYMAGFVAEAVAFLFLAVHVKDKYETKTPTYVFITLAVACFAWKLLDQESFFPTMVVVGLIVIHAFITSLMCSSKWLALGTGMFLLSIPVLFNILPRVLYLDQNGWAHLLWIVGLLFLDKDSE